VKEGERGGNGPIYEGKERRGRDLLLRETGGRKERREGMSLVRPSSHPTRIKINVY